MSETKQQEAITGVETSDTATTATAEVATDAPAATEGEQGPRRRRGGNDRRGGGDRGARRPRRGARPERVRPEFDQKIISIRRVTRVMAGGRRFSFSVAMVIGDKKGRVGVGIGKAGDTQLAIEKAVRDAKKHMIVVPMDKDSRIPHDVHTKVSASEVMIMPAPGRGLVAGSSVRIGPRTRRSEGRDCEDLLSQQEQT
jgi:small subunit ribosomal protein S5